MVVVREISFTKLQSLGCLEEAKYVPFGWVGCLLATISEP